MAGPVDRKLIGESRPARLHMSIVVGFGAVSALLIITQAYLLALIIARAAVEHAPPSALRAALIALAAVLLARAFASGAIELSGRWGAASVMSELRGKLTRRLLIELPGTRAGGARTGELAATAVQGVDALEAYFAGYLPQLVLAALVPPAVIVFAAWADPIAAGLLALTVPILVVFMILVGKRARAHAQRRWRALALLGAHFLDVVQGLGTLRAYRRERAQQRTIGEVGERYRAETMAALRVAFLSALVLELCATIGTALVAATIGVQLVAGVLSLQAGLMVLLLAPEMYGPLRLVGQQFHASADATEASRRLFAALESGADDGALPPLRGSRHDVPRRRPARADLAPAAPDPGLQALRFEGVSYRYPASAVAALQGVELELSPGVTTALVGSSGAGKSTLVRLLLAFAQPTAGTIRCGGREVRELDPEAWRAKICWVPQRPALFTGTLAENLALYQPAAQAGDLERALLAAGGAELLAELPQGLQTMLGEGGRRLSAGQAQRVALARAFLARRPLLVLDEPTAHLDRDTARSVADALTGLMRARTTLLVTHDPHLAELAEECVVLRDGRLLGACAAARLLREPAGSPV